MKNEGIYKITNTINDMVYIGSSINLSNRFKQHANDLKKNKHRSKKLQSFYNTYGNVICFEIIELCDASQLMILEEIYMKKYNSVELGFNMYPTVTNEGFRAMCSELTIKGMTSDVRAKIGATHRGKKETDITKHKKSDSHKGAKNVNFGKPRSEEVKRKISETKRLNRMFK